MACQWCRKGLPCSACCCSPSSAWRARHSNSLEATPHEAWLQRLLHAAPVPVSARRSGDRGGAGVIAGYGFIPVERSEWPARRQWWHRRGRCRTRLHSEAAGERRTAPTAWPVLRSSQLLTSATMAWMAMGAAHGILAALTAAVCLADRAAGAGAQPAARPGAYCGHGGHKQRARPSLRTAGDSAVAAAPPGLLRIRLCQLAQARALPSACQLANPLAYPLGARSESDLQRRSNARDCLI